MGTALHWVNGPWLGKLALASRPRGGEWLDDEMASWQRDGIDMVLSLLTPEEEQALDLAAEAGVTTVVERAGSALSSGKNIAVHCRQGIGRTGLIAACLLISRGVDPEAAVARLSAARGVPVPETPEQRQWIDRYAATLARAN